MIKILQITPFSKDSNSLHRALGPMTYLTKTNRDTFSLSVAQDDLGHNGVSWDTVAQFDLVNYHRPCRNDDLTILKICRNLNTVTISDYDDDLFSVPSWNPHAHVYANPDMQNYIATMAACSDVVTVSTSALYEQFKAVNKNVVIIPNAYRSDLYKYRAEKPPKRNPVIAYRGSNTHEQDMLSVIDGLKKMPAKVLFFGGAPWSVKSQMPANSYQDMGSQDPFLYMKNLYLSAPKVLIVPLVDCHFNRCKSNIAYQEAVHAGALCVAPDMPEWKLPGIINYEAGNSESFLRAVNEAYMMPEDLHAETVANAYTHMKKLYDISFINEIRVNTLKAMLAPDFEKNERDPFDALIGVWAMSHLKKQPMAGLDAETLKSKGIA